MKISRVQALALSHYVSPVASNCSKHPVQEVEIKRFECHNIYFDPSIVLSDCGTPEKGGRKPGST